MQTRKYYRHWTLGADETWYCRHCHHEIGCGHADWCPNPANRAFVVAKCREARRDHHPKVHAYWNGILNTIDLGTP